MSVTHIYMYIYTTKMYSFLSKMKMMVSLTHWACRVFSAALVFNNSFNVFTALYDLSSVESADGKKKKYKKNLPLFDFPRRILSRIVSLLQCVASSARWNPCQPCHLIPGQPRNPPELYETQSRYEFVTSPSFYLGLQAVFSHKAAQWLQAALSQVFLSVAFSPKTKRVVSMLSENYSVQDVSPSYLPMLKDTFLPKSLPFG